MRQLLDTHTFIWFVMGNPRISTRVRALIEHEDNENLLSIASVWEMAIKHSSGKLNLGLPFNVFIAQQLNSMALLNIQLNYIEVVATLPLHHRDPFDRLIIAQAMVEEVPILSVDSAFDAYPIERLW